MTADDPPIALRALAGAWPTPAYIYDLDLMRRRADRLRAAFGGRFAISYAVKANPNRALLAGLAPAVDAFDVSAFAEVERLVAAEREGPPGAARPMSFTGPGKRDEELRRFAGLGRGHIVIESIDEAESLAAIVRRDRLPAQTVVLRINPAALPRRFGASMTGRGSQFGIDEEEAVAALTRLAELPGLVPVGLHCYAATNGLDEAAVAANLAMMAGLFRRCAAAAGLQPELAIFGAGFGLPYVEGEAPLDIDAVAAAAAPALDELRAAPGFAHTRLLLELGRWIVGPAGWLLTTVIRTKTSRGTAIRICDAGFNANMAACGMLGGAFRRNWRILNLSNPDGPPETCDLVGPLCTTLDHVATRITLPAVRTGDVLAIANAGAYGLTASPTRFISHPEPVELLLESGTVRDVSESRANWWSGTEPPA